MAWRILQDDTQTWAWDIETDRFFKYDPLAEAGELTLVTSVEQLTKFVPDLQLTAETDDPPDWVSP